jgi:microcystin degradation protein MlrC
MIDACDATVAYRTNPHLDQRRVGVEAAALLARTLRGEIKPTQAAAFPAVAVSIACQMTSEPPAKRLIDLADEQLSRAGMLSNSVSLGFPYADVEEMGTSFIAVTDGNPDLARRAADEMGAFLVAHRDEFVVALPTPEEAIDLALKSESPVCLLDVGDNVGGGSSADGTVLAAELARRGTNVAPSFVCLYDPEAARRCADLGVGARVELSVGGKTDSLHGAPLTLNAQVKSIHNGRFREAEPRHGGKVEYDMGLSVVVQTPAGLTLLLTSLRTPPFSLGQITSCGLDPSAFRIIVAKGVNAPVAAYASACRTFIRVNTPGVTCADPTLMRYNHRRRPLFPFEDPEARG